MLSQGTGKTICIANKMAFDRQQHTHKPTFGVSKMSQLFVAHSPRICRLVGALQGCPEGLSSAGAGCARMNHIIYIFTYMYIYVYTYIYIYMYAYIYMYIYMHICVYICTYIYVNIYEYMYVYI